MQSDQLGSASTSQSTQTVSGKASTTDSKDMIGWGIIAVLALLFLFMVRSILRSKNAITLPVEGELDRSGKVDSSVSAKEIEVAEKSTSDIAIEAPVERPTAVVEPVAAFEKKKGLKGKKKLQKKKLKDQQNRETTTTGSRLPAVEIKEQVSRSEAVVVRETTDRIFSPAVVTEGDATESVNAAGSSESTVIEPVVTASTYAINAMATRAKTVKTEKPKTEKPSSTKNAAVQGFHKMDRYAEPQRVFASQELTKVIQRVDRQVAAMGDEPSSEKKENAPKPKRNERPAPKSVPAESIGEGPRTLKDFLSKKGPQES